MQQSHKLSFYLILALIFLLPLFFVPGGALTVGVAKSALLIAGTVLAALIFAYELWRDGKLIMPKLWILVIVAALPVVYFLSALLATPSSLSLFGYGFEVGTFGYILLGSILLVIISSVFADTSRSLSAFAAFFVSFAVIAAFAAVKIIVGGDFLALGNFFGSTANPLGGWADLSVAFGLLAALSALTLGMIPVKPLVRTILYATFLLSTALFAVLSYASSFALVFVVSLALILYFSKIEKHYGEDGPKRGFLSHPVILPVLLGLVSLVFLVNPNVSQDRTLSSAVSGALNIQNTEIRPSFSATLGVSKAVLSQVALLGSGPNTFGRDWLIYKPRDINTTPFWAATFPFGAGFLPTQIATTGILGSALWLTFFVLFIILGVKAISRIPGSRAERFALISTLTASLFLWTASFLYAPSSAMLMFAFIFTGLFLAAALQAEATPVHLVDLKKSPQARFANAFVLVLVVAGALFLGWAGYGKTLAAYHFNKAVRLSNTVGTPIADVENSIVKAINTSPEDVYFVALSRLNFSRAQIAASADPSTNSGQAGTPEENQAIFDESIRKSIEAARAAVGRNPASYDNWVALGTIYGALVPEPLAVEGAYESALFAYNEAAKRNPSNPELPLLLARLELNKGDVDAARSYIRGSIALKEDYADAYLMLAQLEQASGNTAAAIASAENLAVLLPENAGIQFELGLLKYSSSNYMGALNAFNRALVISPDYADAKYYLGLTLANLGRFAEAELELEALLDLNPDNQDLLSALEAVKNNKVPAPPAPVATPAQ